MKQILISLIRWYQGISGASGLLPLAVAPQCRFEPTCSEYAVGAIEKHGAMRGSVQAVRRVLRCSPWGGSGVDLP